MHEQYFCMMSGSVRRKMKKLLSVNGQFITFITFMKTKTLQKDKVNIITLGCSKNMVDSEIFSGQLIANEIDVVHESAKKDHNIVVINTCGFIEKAKEESINTILQQVELKKRGKLDKVYVTGCLSERYKNNLEEEIQSVFLLPSSLTLKNEIKTPSSPLSSDKRFADETEDKIEDGLPVKRITLTPEKDSGSGSGGKKTRKHRRHLKIRITKRNNRITRKRTSKKNKKVRKNNRSRK